MNNDNIICKATNQPCSDCTYSCSTKAESINITKKPVDILQKCIDKLNNMTQNEFDRIIKEKGINEKEYKIEQYTDDTFHIVLPLNGDDKNNEN